MRSQLPRGYVRFYKNGKEKTGADGQPKFVGSMLLRLPQEIAHLVDVEQLFKIDIDDAGIHLLPVESVQQALPTWARPSTPDQDGADSEDD